VPRKRSGLEGAARECANALGLDETASAIDAVALFLERSEPFLILVEHVGRLRTPDVTCVPDVDALVAEELRRLYARKIEDERLIEKRKRLGPQNKLLLAMLLERQGERVPLIDLLLANSLRTDTPKRIRELREEHGGWKISSGGNGRGAYYVLESAKPDPGRSARWWLKNNIRTAKDFNAVERILTLLRAHLGNPVPLDDVRYVNPSRESGGRGQMRQAQAETTRRLRSLREEGWQVYSGLDKLVAGLASSDYVMLTLNRLPPYERMKAGVWAAVIERDKRTCQGCGWAPDAGPSQGRKFLEVHHKNPQRARPEDVNDPSNLITLCNVCHDAAS
jgi:hypothetical protein